ncbi:hypothetical protein [Agrobacterium tumefaciens]|uniref:hypothetical protein n=1 Tax=Agrobacterium tumefaciens TaxID=358 RepID=UPI0021D360D7|nr:hypothetical protein [Agrobacterium tumefaciens]
MNVIGYSLDGKSISIEMDGVEYIVPANSPENRHRQMIAEWEALGNVIPPFMPTEEPESVVIVNNVDLWSRMTNVEADQVGAAMEEQTFRVRKIFESASTFRSDHELWPLLQQVATTLFGAERAAQILAPSV